MDKRQDAKSAIIPNEFEPPEEANLEDEASRDENNLDLCAPIVKLRDFDVSPEELFGENVQEGVSNNGARSFQLRTPGTHSANHTFFLG